MLYYRHRRGHYSLAEPSSLRKAVRPVVGVILALLILYVAGSWLLQRIGITNRSRQAAVTVALERRGSVQVSLDGQDFVPAQDGMKLYTSDRLRTGPNTGVGLKFFDGSVMRFDAQSEATILESDARTEDSRITVALTMGSLWISTPATETYTGSILRTVEADDLTFDIPAQSDVLITARSATVFSAAGLGVKIAIPRAVIPIIVGEGQQFALPENYDPRGDLYQYRSPIGGTAATPSFVQESRTLYLTARGPSVTEMASGAVLPSATDLTVTSPTANLTTSSPTIEVKGSVGPKVTAVRVNGYQAQLQENGTFSLELSLPNEESVTVSVEALDAAGNILQTVVREITRNLKPPDAPLITSPAQGGQTYRTQRTELAISGTAPANVAGIIVNDYRLQLFKPGDRTWTYLASTKLQNFQEGENVFTVVSINEAGVKSAPATLTILLGGEGEGVIETKSASSAVSSEITEESLPKNAPIAPGTVQVTGPRPGTQFTSTGSAFLLEGTAPKATASVWVNGYKLRLYTPGKTFWNYLADPALGTLKRGVNTYVINARNAAGEILDSTTYTVTY